MVNVSVKKFFDSVGIEEMNEYLDLTFSLFLIVLCNLPLLETFLFGLLPKGMCSLVSAV